MKQVPEVKSVEKDAENCEITNSEIQKLIRNHWIRQKVSFGFSVFLTAHYHSINHSN